MFACKLIYVVVIIFGVTSRFSKKNRLATTALKNIVLIHPAYITFFTVPPINPFE